MPTQTKLQKWIAVLIISDDGVGDTGPEEFLGEDDIRAILEKGDYVTGVNVDLKSLTRLE